MSKVAHKPRIERRKADGKLIKRCKIKIKITPERTTRKENIKRGDRGKERKGRKKIGKLE